MKKITIEVTQQDIEQGKGHDPWCCPIALALQRVDGVGDCTVGLTRAWFNGNPHSLPDEAKTFLDHFDDWKDMRRGSAPSPIKFDLEVRD